MTTYLNNGGSLNLDINSIAKLTGIENFLTIMTNIYRTILLHSIHAEKLFDSIEPFLIHDSNKLQKLIKMLIAMRRGINNNLNFKVLFKSMLYAIDKQKHIGVPNIFKNTL